MFPERIAQRNELGHYSKYKHPPASLSALAGPPLPAPMRPRQVVARIRRRCSRNVSLPDLLDRPTVWSGSREPSHQLPGLTPPIPILAAMPLRPATLKISMKDTQSALYMPPAVCGAALATFMILNLTFGRASTSRIPWGNVSSTEAGDMVAVLRSDLLAAVRRRRAAAVRQNGLHPARNCVCTTCVDPHAPWWGGAEKISGEFIVENNFAL